MCDCAADVAKYKQERDHYKSLLAESRAECESVRGYWQWEMKQRAMAIMDFQRMHSALVAVHDLCGQAVIEDLQQALSDVGDIVKICLIATNLHPPVADMS